MRNSDVGSDMALCTPHPKRCNLRPGAGSQTDGGAAFDKRDQSHSARGAGAHAGPCSRFLFGPCYYKTEARKKMRSALLGCGMEER